MFPSHASMVWAAVDDGDEKMRKDGQYARYEIEDDLETISRGGMCTYVISY